MPGFARHHEHQHPPQAVTVNSIASVCTPTAVVRPHRKCRSHTHFECPATAWSFTVTLNISSRDLTPPRTARPELMARFPPGRSGAASERGRCRPRSAGRARSGPSRRRVDQELSHPSRALHPHVNELPADLDDLAEPISGHARLAGGLRLDQRALGVVDRAPAAAERLQNLNFVVVSWSCAVGTSGCARRPALTIPPRVSALHRPA